MKYEGNSMWNTMWRSTNQSSGRYRHLPSIQWQSQWYIHWLTPETHHWSMPQKMLKKSCVFTKFFHSFFSQKSTHIIYNLFNFYFSEKSLLFLIKKLIKSELKWLIFISFLYKIKLKFFHCFYTHKNGI